MAAFCPACGTPTMTGARFCSACGGALAPEGVEAADGDNGWVGLATGAERDAARAPVAASASAATSAPQWDGADAARNAYDNTAEYAADETAPPRGRSSIVFPALLLGVAVVGGMGWWAWSWTRGAPTAELAATEDDAPPPDAPATAAWQNDYQDQFIAGNDAALVASSNINIRNLPGTDGTEVVEELPAGTALTGRWVRAGDGGDGRWLRLGDGRYVFGDNLAQPGGAGSPIRINVTNADSSFGPDIGRYLDRASATARANVARAESMAEPERTRYLESIETASTFERIAGGRRWRGLTVTAVGVHYEAGSIYFREGEAELRRALAAAGVRVEADGNIPLTDPEDAGSCSVQSMTGPNLTAEERRLGGSSITCGV